MGEPMREPIMSTTGAYKRANNERDCSLVARLEPMREPMRSAGAYERANKECGGNL